MLLIRRALLKLDRVEKMLIEDGWKFEDSDKGFWEYSKPGKMAVILFHEDTQYDEGIILNPGKDFLQISFDNTNEAEIESALEDMRP